MVEIMVVIHLEQAELYAAGIGQRAYKGGRSVPTEKVILRIPRILAQVKPSIPLCDQARIFDNSSGHDPFQPVMTIRTGRLQQYQGSLAGWSAQLRTVHKRILPYKLRVSSLPE